MPEYKNIINNQVVISGQEEIQRLEKELKSQAQQSDNLQDSLDRTREVLREVRQELDDLKYNSGFEELEAKANKYEDALRRTASELESILISQHLLKGSFDNYDEFEEDIEEVANGYKTINEALVDIKKRYRDVQSEGSGGPLDETMLEVVLATLQKLGDTIDDVSDRLKIMQTEGVKAVAAPADAAQSGNSVANMLREIAEASKEMGDDVEGSQAPMLTLLRTLNELSNVNGENLMNISRTFSGLANIGQGTFGDTKIEGIINLLNRLEEAGTTSKAINIRFDVGGLEDLNIKKSSLKNLAEYLPAIADINADRVKKIFEANPTNGINNLKVSKAALEHLSEKLPTIAGVNANKLEKILNVDTSGINSLKVSKASVENVANLARATEILKNNGIDLTLKGDATEELKNLTQETVNVTDAQAKLRESSKDTGQTVGTSIEPLGKSATLLDGLSLSVESFDEKKLAAINRALKWEGVTNEADREQILSVFKDFDGTITSVQAKWKDFPHIGERVSQVLVKGVDAVGREFQKVINWKELLDKETKTYVPFVEQEETVRYTANMEKLVNMTRAEADVEERLRSIRLDLKSADVNGIAGDNVNYKGVQEYANALRDLLQNTDANSTTQKQFNADLADLEAKYRANTLALRDDITAAKEDAKARSELVNIVEAQAKISKEIRSTENLIEGAKAAGLSENSEDVLALREYVDTLHTLSSDLDPTKTKQRDFIATFNELSASVVDSTLNIERAIDRSKDFAAAEKAAAKAAAELANTVQARGTIGKATAGIDKTVSGAQAVGVSVDNADLQQLAVYRQLLTELDAELDDLNLTQKEFSTIMGNLKAIFQAPEAAVKKLTASLKEQQNHIAKSAKIYDAVKSATEEYADAQNDSNSNVRAAYTVITNLRRELDGAAASYKNGKITAAQYDEAVKSTNDELNEQVKVLKNAGYGADETASKFAQLTQQLTRFITPLYLARKAWQTVKEMANVVIELEDAFAQLQIVTGATDDELEEFYETSAKIASDLGKSITDIAASIEVFSRLGYSLPDATQLAQYATILSNVAGVSTDEATTGLTSIIKGYNMHVEKAEHVSDVLISIGQKYAVSAGEMMEAYERSGAALAATNTSFEKSAAIIAAANAAIQNSSTVGKVLPMHTVMYA